MQQLCLNSLSSFVFLVFVPALMIRAFTAIKNELGSYGLLRFITEQESQ